MNTFAKTWTIPDRRPDHSGPWDDEPDKAQWVDETTGLDCLIVRNHHGALCGYVGVPPGHPWHGKDYDDVSAAVHGGLTYAALCEDDEEAGICHVPEPGRPADVWWFGFDCAHGFIDHIPEMESLHRRIGVPNTLATVDRYRDIGYVAAQCASLAQQVAEAAK